MLHKRHFTKVDFIYIFIVGFTSCIINDNIKDTSALIDPGNDPNFKIVVNTDGGYEVFNRKVVVFNIPIYAFSTVEDIKLLHFANVLAQYLDNDEDGIVDNLIVHDELKANNSFFLFGKLKQREILLLLQTDIMEKILVQMPLILFGIQMVILVILIIL